VTAEINLPLGTRITIHKGTTDDLDVVAVPAAPAEVKQPEKWMPAREHKIEIVSVDRKTGQIGYTLDGGQIFFMKAGDSLTVSCLGEGIQQA
jgi:hypothetical protein